MYVNEVKRLSNFLLVKKLNESKSGTKSDGQSEVRLVDKVDKRDSSGSDTDDPDTEGRGSVLFLQVKYRIMYIITFNSF
jgi:hypothetical protein